MREDTVTNRKPKTTTSTDAITLATAPVGAPGTGLKIYRNYPGEKQCMRGAAFDRASCVCILTPHPVEEKK